ncbi:MAG: bifunctional methylenetetrahydrofolate dehydrogenase/methenyltetrahydrofolate cyclohydrolase FolD [Albidovulum sp.]|nr:bifunctional methylenetetrahydrofolate dehydrogenase/methenyltetrahydrofolate cyclohydrolase FolD [Albidovulum sp.]MDE0304269.1 bifunctional methylenetetrahydrofolate dehydrogenase/methenyltetrahydrofolate cyclohydrolase FolD [Albidovulum sp.]MDE0531556.1 bifunctional methylenetetrahydrofolate dehydrogenase/methenyltetrahydrofolate cyclohydrolase FolD [Albidovulum sp.]
MGATIIKGRATAAELRGYIAKRVAEFGDARGSVPGLAVVLVGDDPASAIYVRNKARKTKEVGMVSFERRFPLEIEQSRLLDHIRDLNDDDRVHGILVQLPLPPQIDANAVLNSIDPSKDVDGFHVSNAGLLATGQNGMVPCTPLGCQILLRRHLGDLAGAEAVVLGRSNIVGKPMANLLLKDNCTVTLAHSRTRDLKDVCARADILVSAVGRARLIGGDWIKPGATVIDVGINRVPAPEKGVGKSKIVGDVNFESALQVAGAITPVPGGVGPMTIACLLSNTLAAAHRITGLADLRSFA